MLASAVDNQDGKQLLGRGASGGTIESDYILNHGTSYHLPKCGDRWVEPSPYLICADLNELASS